MILVGDCREMLRSLPERSVQTCVTSPPYFGLRDYGTGEWEGGDPSCSHAGRVKPRQDTTNGSDGGHFAPGTRGTQPAKGYVEPVREVCRCGARRVDRQIGLEPTPDEFVAALVEVFREVRRVLRDDGTVWLNLGDSYNNRSVARPSSHQGGLGFSNDSIERSWADQTKLGLSRLSFSHDGLKEKDLLGVPWMVAFALRADGWYLRSDVIWSKPNPMPESVRDRPTRAHEYLFLLSKGPRYFYDAGAIREADGGHDHPRSVLNGQPCLEPTNGLMAPHEGLRTTEGRNGAGRNKRSVWTVTTKPYTGAHFATFPPDLIEPCILAGSGAGDTVLDPFAGAGTTGVVCGWHGREFVGVELNPEYAAMAEERIALEGRPGGPPARHEPAAASAGQLGLL